MAKRAVIGNIGILLLLLACLTGCGGQTSIPAAVTKTAVPVTAPGSHTPVSTATPIPTRLPTPVPTSTGTEMNGLVLLTQVDDSILIDLRYAGPNNFTGKTVYPLNICVLQKSTAQKLAKANAELKQKGLRLKVWDAYRPLSVQKLFWDLVKDGRYVANPANGGSKHNRGTAVDVTLTDASGKELPMPSEFDDFSIKASRNNPDLTGERRKNMDLLTDTMVRCGFHTIQTEWWHFEDADTGEYPPLDVDLKQFAEKTTGFDIQELACLGDSLQSVVIVSDSLKSTQALAYTYEKTDGGWREFLPPFKAVIGKNGFTYDKQEGDKRSPIGAFELRRCFSRLPNPGTKLEFTQFEKNDFWVDDSASAYYNTYQKGLPNGRWKSAEDLYKVCGPYKYFIPIEYNTVERVPGKGSAIFLHIWEGEKSSTVGCTAIPEDKLLRIIKWLDPLKKPLIIQGPSAEISRIRRK